MLLVELAPVDQQEGRLSIAIRIAAPSDVEAIIDVWRASGMLSHLNNPRDDLEFALASPCSTVFVAVDEIGRIAGTVMAGHDGHRGNLYYVAVHPQFRLQGIGTRLLAVAERWLREAGIRKIHLLVLRENLDVKPFYEKSGYGEAPAVLLRKWLVRPSE
jgi:ribosomal protein S18 acetylase RimI-like enzyme